MVLAQDFVMDADLHCRFCRCEEQDVQVWRLSETSVLLHPRIATLVLQVPQAFRHQLYIWSQDLRSRGLQQGDLQTIHKIMCSTHARRHRWRIMETWLISRDDGAQITGAASISTSTIESAKVTSLPGAARTDFSSHFAAPEEQSMALQKVTRGFISWLSLMIPSLSDRIRKFCSLHRNASHEYLNAAALT